MNENERNEAEMSAKRLYDWDDLLSREHFSLVRGTDFWCSFAGMSQQVRQAASKRGVHVAIIETETGINVVTKREQDAAAQA